MSCEEEAAEVKQAWRDWQIALDKHLSLVKPGGITVVDSAGARAIEEAGQEFAAADRRFIAAVQAHLDCIETHRSRSN